VSTASLSPTEAFTASYTSVVVTDNWCGDKWNGLDKPTPGTAAARAGLDDLQNKVAGDWSDLSNGDRDRLHDELGHV
jgi:hypothetical protein